MNNRQIKDYEEYAQMAERGQEKDCNTCCCSVCIAKETELHRLAELGKEAEAKLNGVNENARLYPSCFDEEGLVEWSTNYAFKRISEDYDGKITDLVYDLVIIGVKRELVSLISSYIEYAINVECDDFLDDEDEYF